MRTLVLLALVLGGCDGNTDATDIDTDTDTDTDTERPENHEVVITTRLGEIAIDVLDDEVPRAAANFRQYAGDGYYDGADGGRATLVHNIQIPLYFEAGVYETNLAEKAVGTPVSNESVGGPSNTRGTVAFIPSQTTGEHTAGFIFNAQDNTYLDGKEGDPGYTVFGNVVDGMDVVDAIMAESTTSRGGFDAIPETDIVIDKVEVLR